MVKLFNSASPFEALELVARRGPSAGQALIRWLFQHPAVWSLPPGIREDVIQSVGCKLLQCAQQIVTRVRLANPNDSGAAFDHKLTSYVGSMLRNQSLDLQKKSHSCVPLDETKLIASPRPDLRIELQEILHSMQMALLEVAKRGTEEAAVVEQLLALATGMADMDELVDNEGGNEFRSRVRDRIYKRHRRARQHVVQVLAAMGQDGRLKAGVVRGASIAVERLLRAR